MHSFWHGRASTSQDTFIKKQILCLKWLAFMDKLQWYKSVEEFEEINSIFETAAL